MNTKKDAQAIRTLNEIRLLNLIRERGPISRNELAKLTNISKVTVSDVINRLNNAGFILEMGKGKSTRKGGKKPTLLKLNPDNGYVVGIQIERNQAIIALANIEAEIRGITMLSFNIGASMEDVIPYIFDKIDLLLAQNKVQQEKLISIGIGIPGFIDYAKGELRFAVTLRGWTNLPLSSQFEDRYQVPTIIENDVNTITISESLLGAGRGSSNLACIWIGDGIGAGIIVDGKIVRGETGNAGEIGYLELGNYITDVSRMKSLYNNQHYFGELLSEVNLFETLKMRLKTTKSLEDILAWGDDGNSMVQDILNEYAYPLSVVCLNIIKSINPGLIIISGRIIENSIYLYQKVRQLVEQNMINIPFKPSTIIPGELKDEAGVKGAIAMALQTLFEPNNNK